MDVRKSGSWISLGSEDAIREENVFPTRELVSIYLSSTMCTSSLNIEGTFGFNIFGMSETNLASFGTDISKLDGYSHFFNYLVKIEHIPKEKRLWCTLQILR